MKCVAAMEEQIQKTIELQNEAAVLMNTRPAASSKEERDERLRGLFQVKLEAYQARPVGAMCLRRLLRSVSSEV